MRLKKSLKNLIYSFGYYIVTILGSFVLRKIMLFTIGLSGVSLNSLFNEIIAMLSLSELGVGTAIVYNLYKPLSEKDEKKIQQLMWLFKKAYWIIAGVVLILGVVLLPFITQIVNGVGFSKGYIRYIYLLFVIQTALSYLFAYKRTLLAADQKNYVSATIDSVFKIVIIVCGCIVLLFTKRFDIYLYTLIVLQFTNNIWISQKVDSLYPYIKNNKEKLPNEEIKQVLSNVMNLFVGKVSGTVTNSTDNILISVLVNTLECGLYANYALIINAVKQILVQMTNAIQGSVGNLYAEGDNEHIVEVYKRMTYMYFILALIFCTGYMCGATSFISWIFGKKYVMVNAVLFVTTINMFFHILRDPLWQMITVSGLFSEDKYIALIGTLVNLIVSVLIGIKYGLVGIFLGTTATYVIQIFLKIILLCKKGLKIKCKKIFIFWIYLIVTFGISVIIAYSISQKLFLKNDMYTFLYRCIISEIISLVISLALTAKCKEFKYCILLIKK